MAHRERRMVSATPIPDETGPMQDGLPRSFWVRVVNFAALDDFGTKFDKNAFGEYLQSRMPRFLYGHNWSDPTALVGKGTEHRSSNEGLDVRFLLDDFDYVPNARQIAYQVQNGTLDQFSVDFVRQRDRRDAEGVIWITKARLPAVSGVPEGAVPGTRVLTRMPGVKLASPGATISLSDALNVMSHLALGELDLVEALNQLKEAATSDETLEEDEEKEAGAEGGTEKTDDTPPEDVPVVEDKVEATETPADAPDATDANGGTPVANVVDDTEGLAMADEVLALLDGRF